MTDEEVLAAAEKVFRVAAKPDHIWLQVDGVPKHYELKHGEYVETPWVEL